MKVTMIVLKLWLKIPYIDFIVSSRTDFISKAKCSDDEHGIP
jgi:hypothetical protein